MGANMSNVVKNDNSVVILLMKDLLDVEGMHTMVVWRLIATDLILTNQKARNSHKMFQRSQKLVQVTSILGHFSALGPATR
jgi:hypothetical protein